MTDNLEPLSVEKINLAVSKAVNAAFLPQSFTQKPKCANVLPGESFNITNCRVVRVREQRTHDTMGLFT